ncbi:hypothetical protein GGD83_003645 [Rhodoblastus sphagnicola]|uniref:hypothetical protein n=1 Tax=Rhodoblastus sphagnicola TaxID=333368 RepID=UPI0011B076C8|nr:hypothetical protein [Rhodoblastus sphagnicola]MBB4199821.1 hypothetical protein [Rhodoblastus sphagnicola]
MAKGRTQKAELERWRTWLVRLTAFAFLFQVIGLFVAPARRPVAVQREAAQALSHVHQMADCPHHHARTKPGKDAPQDGCPMCQTLGCALPGADAPIGIAFVHERLIGRLRIVSSVRARAPPPLQSAQPRGPPTLV